MDFKKIIENVARGLRRMDVKPDYFIFIEQEEWTWDEDDICGIPVIHAVEITSYYDSSMTESCPFIPCWKKEQSNIMRHNNSFHRGWDE